MMLIIIVHKFFGHFAVIPRAEFYTLCL